MRRGGLGRDKVRRSAVAKSLLWYGETGTFKTTQIKFLARYVYEKYGKTTRVIYTGASDGALTKPEERAGILESWQIASQSNPLPVIRKLSQGFWPRIVDTGGLRTLQMVAPTAETWKKVGCVILDGITMGSDFVMADVVDKNRQIAEEVVGSFQETITVVNSAGVTSVDTEKFGAPGRAHYNFGQKFAYSTINAFSSLPVEVVGFTALEAKAEEEDRSTIYGPALPGKKATPKAPSWVGDCLHFEGYNVPKEIPVLDDKGAPRLDANKKPLVETIYETKVRCYFMRHPDPKTGINFPAKPRVDSSKIPQLLAKWPGGYFVPTPTEGLDMYLRFLDELEGEAADSLIAWREKMDAARLGSGGTVSAAPATAAAAPAPAKK
jgi:hypothetical protein